ncbi:MAG: hypothetical protein M3O36_17800 [Myxococcota bacterium]|nr:hypothetical protein [Myxococcota bacterium]
MQEPWPLVLLLFAAIVILIQSWRLGLQVRIARANQAAALREDDRQAAAHARRLRAVDGEDGAFALLERAGYGVLGRQVPGSWTVRANGEPVSFGLRADYLVARQGRRYIAEVKTGRLAPSLSHGPTRRQLLEYGAAFDVHGVVLVDADAETITHVEIDLFGRSVPTVKRGGITLHMAIVLLLFFSLGLTVGAAIIK